MKSHPRTILFLLALILAAAVLCIGAIVFKGLAHLPRHQFTPMVWDFREDTHISRVAWPSENTTRVLDYQNLDLTILSRHGGRFRQNVSSAAVTRDFYIKKGEVISAWVVHLEGRMPVEQGVVKARKILHEWDGENPKRFEGWMYGKKYDSVDDWVVDIAAGKIVPDRVELIGFSCRVAIVLHDPPEKGLKRRCSLSFYP